MSKFKIFPVLTLLALMPAGCASYKPNFDPHAAYFDRVQTVEKEGVKVSVVGLSSKESREVFGTNLTSMKILPLWIKVENGDPEHSYFFLQRSVDPDYYTAGEAAFISQFHAGYRLREFFPPFMMGAVRAFAFPFDSLLAGRANTRMRTEFAHRALNNGWINPHDTKSGFVFVPFVLGTKEIQIDLYSDEIKQSRAGHKSFNFFIHIPGLKMDYSEKDISQYYSTHQFTEIENEVDLLRTLEALPCCISSRNGNADADPINLIVIGEPEDILNAFVSAKWDETETVYWGSIWKMMGSFSFKKKYRYSPISPQYYDGRSQDIAFQKARETINERMHLRLWYSPFKYQGKAVWIGAVSRDIGVRFTTKAWNLMTHAIDPDLDEAAVYVLSDLIYRQRVEKYGIVGGVPASTEEAPSHNMMGAPYFTSGKRTVLLLSKLRHPEFPARMMPEVKQNTV